MKKEHLQRHQAPGIAADARQKEKFSKNILKSRIKNGNCRYLHYNDIVQRI